MLFRRIYEIQILLNRDTFSFSLRHIIKVSLVFFGRII